MENKCKQLSVIKRISVILLCIIMVTSLSEGWWSRAAYEPVSRTMNVYEGNPAHNKIIGTTTLDITWRTGLYEAVPYFKITKPDFLSAADLTYCVCNIHTGPSISDSILMSYNVANSNFIMYNSGLRPGSWDPVTCAISLEIKTPAGVYYVNYMDSDGSIIGYAETTPGDGNICSWNHIDAPAPPEGKSFIGWSTSKTKFAPANSYASISAFTNQELTLYAYYDLAATVSFDLNGADCTKPSNIIYTGDGSYTFPPDDNSLIRNGYTFMGWGDAADSYTTGGTLYQPGTALVLPNLDNNKVYYAQWAKSYTVDYNLNGSTAAAPQTSTAIAGPDGSVDITAAPSNGITRPGYAFKGWSTDPDSTTADIVPGSTLTISDDTTLYAVWSKNDYTISFHLNGAVNNPAPVLNDETGYYNDTFTLPNPALVKDHYTFKGWCADQNGSGTIYSGGSFLTIGDDTPQNLMLYAKWDDSEQYTLAFDKGGDDVGGTLPSGGTYYNDSLNDTVTLPASTLTKTGYSFAGWTKTKGSSTVDYVDGAAFQITESMTLYPVWTAGSFTLGYDFNGEGDAVSDAVPGSVQGGPGSPITAALQGGMYRPYYRFTGWNTAANGTGTAYVPGTPVLLDHNITLYAQWEALTPVHITYYTNCSDALIQAPSDTTDYYADGLNEDGNVTSVVLNRFGYHFKGWNTKDDGTGTSYAAGADIKVTEDTDLFAVWEEGTYTLSYDKNGTGVTGDLPDNVTGKLNTIIRAGSGDNLKLAHHHFKEWNTASDGTGTGYQPGDKVSLGADTTLYAIWEKNNYEITYSLNADDAQGTVPSKDSGTYDETFTAPSLDGISRSKYKPVGWNDDPEGNGKDYTPGTSYYFDDTKTLYVKWDDVEQYTLAFDKGGNDVNGTLPSGGTYYNNGLDDTVTLPASTLTRTGYSFAGWTKTKGSNTVDYVDGATFQITESMTLYPVWTAGTFTLDYDFNGEGDAVSDAVPSSVQGGPGSPITAAPQGGMYRPYYRFTGWNTAANGTGTAYAPGSPVLLDHNITLYAQWEALDPVSVTYHTNCSDTLIQAPVDTKEYYADGINEDGSVTSVVLNRFGYNFKGWNTEANGTGTSYAAGADIKVTEDTDLFAVWEEGTYTLSYNKNGAGVTGELPDSVTGKLNSIIRAGSGDNLKLARHHFKEWNTASDGTGTGYQPGGKVSLGADTTLYAIWEKNNYEITYSLNADDAKGTVPSKDSGAYDETFTAPLLNGISRPKYKPVGWNDDPDGNGKDYTPGTSYHFDDTKTLYVKWEAVPPYEVHYFKNASDATGTPPEDNNTYCEDGVTETSVTVLDQNDLKRPGYEFAGWNTKPNGTGLTYQPGDDFIIKTHMNFYAQWKIGTYTLNFDKGHSAVTGNGPAALKSRSDKDITLPKEGGFKRKDFGFTGWNTKADGSGTFYKAGSKLKILEDTTIYAQWKRLVNVSFDNSDGALKGDTSLQVTEGTKLGDVKLPSVNSGYTVKEWIINGEKVTDYKNYVVDKDSDVVLVLEKKKDPVPAPKPTPGGDTTPDKPDKDNPNKDNPNGGGSNNGGSGNGSGENSSGSNNNSGSNSQSSGSTGYTSGGTANSVISGQIGSSGRSFEPGKPISGNTDTAGQNNTGSSTESTGELTTIQEEQVPLSSGSGIFGQSEKTGKSGSAYGSIWECIVHWLVLLGMLVNTLYAFLRGRHIRKKRLLGSGFFADTLLPMLAVPLCVLAFEFQKCALDIYFILAWALLAMGTLYHINRQFQKNADEVEQELGQ